MYFSVYFIISMYESTCNTCDHRNRTSPYVIIGFHTCDIGNPGFISTFRRSFVSKMAERNVTLPKLRFTRFTRKSVISHGNYAGEIPITVIS